MSKQAIETKTVTGRANVVDSLNLSVLMVAAQLAEFAYVLKRTEGVASGRPKQRV